MMVDGGKAPTAWHREAMYPGNEDSSEFRGLCLYSFPQVLLWFFPHILNPMYYIPFFPSQCLPFKSRNPVRLIVQLALEFIQSQGGVLSEVQQSQPGGSGDKHVPQANFASLELEI